MAKEQCDKNSVTPRADALVDAYLEKCDRVFPDGSSAEDIERDLREPVRQLERELAAMTADRDMWLKDDVKQNDALGRVIAERDTARSSTRDSELCKQQAEELEFLVDREGLSQRAKNAMREAAHMLREPVSAIGLKWTKTREEQPSGEVDVVAWWNKEVGVAHHTAGHRWHNPEDEDDVYREPDYWMPLPNVPTDDTGQKP